MATKNTTDHLNYGAEIKRLREKHKIGQRELARKLKLSPVYLNNIENGRKTLSLQKANTFLNLLGYSLVVKLEKISDKKSVRG